MPTLTQANLAELTQELKALGFGNVQPLSLHYATLVPPDETPEEEKSRHRRAEKSVRELLSFSLKEKLDKIQVSKASSPIGTAEHFSLRCILILEDSAHD